MGDATRLGAGTAAARDTLAQAVARRHACVKAAVKASLSKRQIAVRTGVERNMSLKLNTRETQLKLPGFKAPVQGWVQGWVQCSFFEQKMEFLRKK